MSKLKRARTCEGCRAACLQCAHGWKRGVGYATDSDKGIPLEPCPKPRTLAEGAVTFDKNDPLNHFTL